MAVVGPGGSVSGTPIVPAPAAPSPPPRGDRLSARLRPVTSFLRQHPVLCLFLMTPGFPEYLSGSSSLADLVLSPGWFFLALGINAAMYTAGALLIREVTIRWHKGWGTVFVLGGAYAIMEEGIADQTIFNPNTTPIGAAGNYGQWLGVNWLWVPDILVIHIFMSIGIPLLFLSYVFPELEGKRLVSDRGLWQLLALLAADTAFLTAIVVASRHFWYGLPLLLAAVLAIVGLCALAWKLPRYLLHPRPGPPTGSRLQFFLVGAAVYPLMVLFAVLGAGRGAPPTLVFCAILAEAGLLGWWSIAHLGTVRFERQLIAFGAGLLSLGFVLGIVLEFPIEIVLLADVALVYFLYRLDRSFLHRDRTEPPAPLPLAKAAPQ